MNGKDIKANQLRSVWRLVRVRWCWGILSAEVQSGESKWDKDILIPHWT